MKKKIIAGIMISLGFISLASCDSNTNNSNTTTTIATTIDTKTRHKVLFDACGGEVRGKSEYLTFCRYLDMIDIPTPKKRGYTFLGWVDEVGEYLNESLFFYQEDKTFYARWVLNDTVGVYFDPNGGSVSYTYEEVVIDSYYKLPIPTREGYSFLGWYDTSNHRVKDGYFTYTSDVDLTARWGKGYNEIEDKTITVALTNDYGNMIYDEVINYLDTNGVYSDDFTIKVEYVSKEELEDVIKSDSVDLCICDQNTTNKFGKKGYLLDFGTDIIDEVNERAVGKIGIRYGYPLSISDCLVMYYNKSLFEGVDMNSLDAIIAKCKEDNIYMSYQLEKTYHSVGFFLGTGFESEWVTNENDEFVGYMDNLGNSDCLYALEAVYKLYDSSIIASNDGKTIGVCIDGSFEASNQKIALGDDFAVAKLPSFTASNGINYQMGSFINANYVSVIKQDDKTKEELLTKISEYLFSKECQEERFAYNAYPADKEAYTCDGLALDEVSLAIKDEAKYATLLGRMPKNWWNTFDTLLSRVFHSNGSFQALEYAQTSYVLDLQMLISCPTLMVGSFEQWNNQDEDYILSVNSDDLYEITIYIDPSDPVKCGRLVYKGTWTIVAGFSNCDLASQKLLDLDLCQSENPDDNIYFKEAGTYKILLNLKDRIVSITKI